MEDALQLPVSFNDDVLEFPFRVAHTTYGRKFMVMANGVEVHFETDDSGELRAVIPNINDLKSPLPSKALVEAIGESIKALIA